VVLNASLVAVDIKNGLAKAKAFVTVSEALYNRTHRFALDVQDFIASGDVSLGGKGEQAQAALRLATVM
jgi:hypothetical protein